MDGKYTIIIVSVVLMELIIAIFGSVMIYNNMPLYDMKAQSEYKKTAFLMLFFILLIIPAALIVAYLIKQ